MPLEWLQVMGSTIHSFFPDEFIALLLKGWPWTSCISITWDLVQKCRILGPTLDLNLFNQKCIGEMFVQV